MSSIEDILHFEIKGSSGSLYGVTAEGIGQSLRMFCKCPAGRNRNSFCKHKAALLMGDISNAVSGVENVEELKRRAVGSLLYDEAVAYYPKQKAKRIDGITSVDDVFEYCQTHMGRIQGFSISSDDDVKLVAIHKTNPRTGRLLKHTIVSLQYKKYAWDDVETDDGRYYRANVHISSKPWCLRRSDGSPRTFAAADTALAAFLETVKAIGTEF